METIRFEESGLDERIIRAVKEMGFESMSPIQQEAIPAVLKGEDIIGQAQTGTGKTAAFGIPVLQMIEPHVKGVQCIVLCPTRELAIQAADEIRKYAKYMHGIKVLPIYGGQDINRQIRSLAGNVQIVVGTPGRVMDHMRRHTLKLKNIKVMVLDEADEMLNMGFREDIETILQGVNEEHQTVLFSATMPQAILEITSRYQKPDAKHIQIQKKELTVPLVKQYYYEVKRENKEEVAARLLDYYNPRQTLIFCNTKKMVDELSEKLKGRGYFAEGLHGDLSQAQRDKVMNGFRNGTTEILIATDVAARGIDVDDVEAVINYDVPQDIEYYVHRIGRTGRAGRSGRSFTLVVGREIYKIREIERTCNTKIKARRVPSGADVTAAKSEKILNEIIGVLKEQDLSKMLPIIEAKLNEEDCTAMELCAAFLKQQMGEEAKDIPTEDYFAERKRLKMEERRGRRERVERYRNERDGRRGRRTDDFDGRGGRKRDEFKGRGDRNNRGTDRRQNERDGRRATGFDDKKSGRREKGSERNGMPSSKDIRRDGSVKGSKSRFHFDKNETGSSYDKSEVSQENSRKIKTLSSKSNKKPENKISFKEYTKRFKF